MVFAPKDSSGKCSLCNDGYSVYYHDFCDGRGREKMHRIYDEDGEPDSTFCAVEPSWFERHPFYAGYWSVVLAGIVGIAFAIVAQG